MSPLSSVSASLRGEWKVEDKLKDTDISVWDSNFCFFFSIRFILWQSGGTFAYTVPPWTYVTVLCVKYKVLYRSEKLLLLKEMMMHRYYPYRNAIYNNTAATGSVFPQNERWGKLWMQEHRCNASNSSVTAARFTLCVFFIIISPLSTSLQHVMHALTETRHHISHKVLSHHICSRLKKEELTCVRLRYEKPPVGFSLAFTCDGMFWRDSRLLETPFHNRKVPLHARFYRGDKKKPRERKDGSSVNTFWGGTFRAKLVNLQAFSAAVNIWARIRSVRSDSWETSSALSHWYKSSQLLWHFAWVNQVAVLSRIVSCQQQSWASWDPHPTLPDSIQAAGGGFDTRRIE